MTVEDGSKDALKAYEAGEDEAWDPVAEAMVDTSDWIHGLADIAEEWMNEYLAPTGHTFGWHEGEFFLWTDEEWVHAC
ncbi:hypothetical protein OG474_30125 [Kribbella sp. NBC_01505]|uniref:hypothetical protein n=1 Tax=Kribbella sp. NBC_01505 TaxID=2903580 RepID=UPI0038678126